MKEDTVRWVPDLGKAIDTQIINGDIWDAAMMSMPSPEPLSHQLLELECDISYSHYD